MWISKKKYEQYLDNYKQLEEENKKLKEDKGIAVAERVYNLAKKCGVDIHSDTFQDIMSRLFLSLAGRESNVMKTYSATTFLKDTDEELMKRLKQLKEEESIITKRLVKKK